MSNLTDSIAAAVDEQVDGPVPDGEAVVDAPEATPEAAPVPDEIDYLDTSEIGDRMVKLKVDGEEYMLMDESDILAILA